MQVSLDEVLLNDDGYSDTDLPNNLSREEQEKNMTRLAFNAETNEGKILLQTNVERRLDSKSDELKNDEQKLDRAKRLGSLVLPSVIPNEGLAHYSIWST